jgi:hypothetical protein
MRKAFGQSARVLLSFSRASLPSQGKREIQHEEKLFENI